MPRESRDVLLRYAIVATSPIIYAVWRGDIAHRGQGLQCTSTLYEVAWLSIYPGMLIDYALWFIPVIALYYLAARFLIHMDRSPPGYLLLVSLLSVRSQPSPDVQQRPQLAASYVFYLLLCLWHVPQSLSPPSGDSDPPQSRRSTLGLSSSLAGHFVLVDQGGIYQASHLFSFEHGLIDWLYLKKMLLAVLLFGSLSYFNRARLDALDHIADVSFTIYFIHLYIPFTLKLAFHWLVFDGDILSWLTVYAANVGL